MLLRRIDFPEFPTYVKYNYKVCTLWLAVGAASRINDLERGKLRSRCFIIGSSHFRCMILLPLSHLVSGWHSKVISIIRSPVPAIQASFCNGTLNLSTRYERRMWQPTRPVESENRLRRHAVPLLISARTLPSVGARWLLNPTRIKKRPPSILTAAHFPLEK